MNRKLGVVLFLMAALLIVAPVAASAAEPVVIKHWIWLDNPNDPTYMNLVKKFNDTHPGIKVEAELVGWNNFHDKLINAVISGDAPDSSSFKLTWLPEFLSMNALEPLDGYTKSWKGYSDIVPNILKVLRQAPDGKLYLMPWEVQALYLYYRVDMFNELGLKPPKTIDEFLAAAKALTRDTDGDGKIDVYGYGMRGARYGHEPWGSFVLSNGVQFFDKNGKVAIDTPAAVEANQFFIDLFRKYKVVPPTAPNDGFAEIIGAFKAGKTAMVVHHIKSSQDMVKLFGDKVSAIPVPAGKKGRWTSMGDTENVLFASSKHKKEAFTFISWMAEAAQIDTWARSVGSVPVSQSVAKMPYYKNDPFQKASTESLPFAGVFPVRAEMGEWIEHTWPATFQRALLGEISSAEMMKILADAMAGKK